MKEVLESHFLRILNGHVLVIVKYCYYYQIKTGTKIFNNEKSKVTFGFTYMSWETCNMTLK